MIFLPRQARDRHRENSKKGPFSSQYFDFVLGDPYPVRKTPFWSQFLEK
jgi:hypothetical protein